MIIFVSNTKPNHKSRNATKSKSMSYAILVREPCLRFEVNFPVSSAYNITIKINKNQNISIG